MSATNAPFGLRPVYHPTGFDRAMAYPITSAYATSIFKFDPVILNTNGTVIMGTAAADLLGSFAGCEYIDLTGKPTSSNFWPAAQAAFAGTVPVCYVFDHPDNVYEIQANGPIAATAVGDQADVVIGAGSSQLGISTTAMGAVVGAGVQGQLRIMDFSRDAGNAAGDAFTVVQVKIARHQFVANKVAI